LARNYRKLLSYDSISLENLDLRFTVAELKKKNCVEDVELIENGSKIVVTKDNLKSYIYALLYHRLFLGIHEQMAAIRAGLDSVIPLLLFRMFSPEELMNLFCGKLQIDIKLLRGKTKYEKKENNPLVEWFWEILEEMTDEERSKLLLFATG
jgi:hypothetical protein